MSVILPSPSLTGLVPRDGNGDVSSGGGTPGSLNIRYSETSRRDIPSRPRTALDGGCLVPKETGTTQPLTSAQASPPSRPTPFSGCAARLRKPQTILSLVTVRKPKKKRDIKRSARSVADRAMGFPRLRTAHMRGTEPVLTRPSLPSRIASRGSVVRSIFPRRWHACPWEDDRSGGFSYDSVVESGLYGKSHTLQGPT